MTDQLHNNLVRFFLRRPEQISAFLRAVLPAAVQAELNLVVVRDAAENFVDDNLSSREADILCTVELHEPHSGGEAVAYVLIEHQSQADPAMAYRLFRYVADIWSRHKRDEAGSVVLPPVIPVVLFHGERPWHASRDVCGLVGGSRALVRALSPHMPGFSYLLEDLTIESDEDIIRRFGDKKVQLMLLLLRHGRSPEPIGPKLHEWLNLMRRVRSTPDGRQYSRAVLEYLYSVRERAEWRNIDEVASLLGPEERKIAVTIAETLRAEGRAEGEVRGRAEGEVKGRVATLCKLLKLKFGDVSEQALERLEHASPAELDLWTGRILEAKSLEELFQA